MASQGTVIVRPLVKSKQLHDGNTERFGKSIKRLNGSSSDHFKESLLGHSSQAPKFEAKVKLVAPAKIAIGFPFKTFIGWEADSKTSFLRRKVARLAKTNSSQELRILAVFNSYRTRYSDM